MRSRWGESASSATAPAYIPLSFAPGEAYQFDWSHEIVVLNGATVTVKVAHVRLCHSRLMFVRAYPRETPGDGVRRPRSRLPRSFAAPAGAAFTTIYGRLPRKAICWGRRLECTNLSGLLRDDWRPWP